MIEMNQKYFFNKKINIIVKHSRDRFVIYKVKKCFSILMLFVMVAAISHISVATHYCGGEIAASKVSLTGMLAGCGMEGNDTALPFSGKSFTKHCCEDVVTFCITDDNYTPAFSFVPEYFQYNTLNLSIPGLSFAGSGRDSNPQYINVFPPGAHLYTDVDLSGICVFRI